MEKRKIEKLIIEFITNKKIPQSVATSLKTEDYNQKYIYNEASFQHELGQFLRKKLKDDNCIVQYERNVKELINYKDFKSNNPEEKWDNKSEMDILVIEDNKNYYEIELKYHKKNRRVGNDEIIYGEIPDYMYHCIEDIRFTYDLKHKLKFKETYCVTIAEDETFYTAKRKDSKNGIYQYFRGGPIIKKDKVYMQRKDIEKQGEGIRIKEFYKLFPVKWNNIYINSKERYYLIKF